MRTQNAPTIRLKDYAPPHYLIDTVELDITLHPTDTRVRATLHIRRLDYTERSTPLVLDGDELRLVHIAVDGRSLQTGEYTVTEDDLKIASPPVRDTFIVEVETSVSPQSNTKLMGLYRSSGVYCTQCEAEGFRRITYFMDRPDVLAVYTVRIEADLETCPQLLCNGNPVESGKLENGRHFSIWHDPHPKPSYLFALVGGNLDALSNSFTTTSGRDVRLNIYVEKGKAKMAEYAMSALKRSMVWDEDNYGREYDLDVFNIVAVSDFNMGAMENKGLNIFNDKYVLADENLATDSDYEHIEAIIAHEYFHNWTGNRITCRDWFQLCLKEGLTVYRDQEFSADMRSRAVQRIQQVRTLWAGQFPEDAGPLAHPVRPQKYQEINNFYTATVYQKGAELVRMLATLIGPETYRKATDLYFARHDGEAARVEDFLACFADTSGLDLTQFALWYEQAGTPVVEIKDEYDEQTQRYTLKLSQHTPPTPTQDEKEPVVIPIRFGLLGSDGKEIEAATAGDLVKEDCIILREKEAVVAFDNISQRPVVSLLRGFSAPVTLKYKEDDAAILLKAGHDGDPFNRWSALNGLLLQRMSGHALTTHGDEPVLDQPILDAIQSSAFDNSLDRAFRAQVLTLPNDQDVAREIAKDVNPNTVVRATAQAHKEICEALTDRGLDLYNHLTNSEGDGDPAGTRALKNTLLRLLLANRDPVVIDFALKQFENSTNMTDRLGALSALLTWSNDDERVDEALDTYYRQFETEPLAIDKWFMLQATIGGEDGFERVKSLINHSAFTLENPNRARSLLAPFAMRNISGFHQPNGAGYDLFARQILAIDAINPQLAARLLTSMNNWRTLEAGRRAKAQDALSSISAAKRLSRDTREIVDRCLE